jgi:hypothetical protein
MGGANFFVWKSVMGKHDSGYERIDKDYYPTPPWVTGALCEYIDLVGKQVWECACGNGRIAEPLKAAGAIVRSTDIEDRGYTAFDGVFDFLSAEDPPFDFDAIVTNPAWGERNRMAEAFIKIGLRRTADRGSLALLLPIDFDSGITRRKFFGDCPRFVGKLIPMGRVAWFSRTDGKREAKENVAWYFWARDPRHAPPTVRYSRHHAALKADYPDVPPPTRFEPPPSPVSRSEAAIKFIDGGPA